MNFSSIQTMTTNTSTNCGCGSQGMNRAQRNVGTSIANRSVPPSPSTFRQNLASLNSAMAAKYKMLVTGGNDPHISSRMKYAHYARNSPIFHRYPILNLKQPTTGNNQPVIQASTRQTYLPNNSSIQTMTKVFCIQYNWQ